MTYVLALVLMLVSPHDGELYFRVEAYDAGTKEECEAQAADLKVNWNVANGGELLHADCLPQTKKSF